MKYGAGLIEILARGDCVVNVIFIFKGNFLAMTGKKKRRNEILSKVYQDICSWGLLRQCHIYFRGEFPRNDGEKGISSQ
jgi:hypothetical protein